MSVNSLSSNRSLVSALWPLVFVKYILGELSFVTVRDFPGIFNWPISRYTWFVFERFCALTVKQDTFAMGRNKRTLLDTYVELQPRSVFKYKSFFSRWVLLQSGYSARILRHCFLGGWPTVWILWVNLLHILHIGSNTLSTLIWKCQIVFVSMLIVVSFMKVYCPFYLFRIFLWNTFPISISRILDHGKYFRVVLL